MTDALPPESFYLREDYGGGNRGSRTSVSSKNIYFLPHPIRTLLQGDHTQRLKIVTAGVKLFEKKVTQSGAIDYRLLHVSNYPTYLVHNNCI